MKKKQQNKTNERSANGTPRGFMTKETKAQESRVREAEGSDSAKEEM